MTNEYRVRWQQCPHINHPIQVLFVTAETEADAKELAKYHIEHKYGFEWFSIYEAAAQAPPPRGAIKGGA